MEQITHYIDVIDKELSKYPILVQIDQKAGTPKAKTYAVMALSVVYVFLIIFNFAGQLLTNFLGLLYPAWASFRAIESTRKDDDTQWLTYWTVFGFLNTIEFFSDLILYWMPFYFLLKAALIVYMILPQFNGAEVLYQRFFRPVLLENLGMVDGMASKAKKAVAEALSEKQD